MNANLIVEKIIECLGQKGNISNVTNCMTRLRVVVKSEDGIDEKALSEIDSVLGIVHDRSCSYEIVVGPGNSKKYADICHEMGISSSLQSNDDWKANKDEFKKNLKKNPIRDAMKVVGDIFVPLIPGIITAGICAGLASLISQLVPDMANKPAWNGIYTFLSLINQAFMTYITAWAGYRAAERFGATPILGGMLGMITSLDGINTISGILGLFNEDDALRSILRTGRGGVIAVIFGILLLSYVEKKIRKHMPASLDIIFTPLLSLLICLIPYIFCMMPLFGFVSDGIVNVFSKSCMSESAVIRMLTGYLASALFLPLVAAGMHHGLVALYAVQLQELGYVTLYPALAMAGAGQVGAAIAIYLRAKRLKQNKLCSIIKGALPAGVLGVGEPLIYGVTLPMGRPFVTAGIGAGFGGAFVMLFRVASTTWGPSGVLGAFVMTAGPLGAAKSIIVYLVGLVISCIASFFITEWTIHDEIITSSTGENTQPVKVNADENEEDNIFTVVHKSVSHGTSISMEVDTCLIFEHIISDPMGIHARPASAIAEIVSNNSCQVNITNGEKSASGSSITELLSLGASKGNSITVNVEGKDAKKAALALKHYMEEKL